jgi:prepilin-type N-terminal cleavage/methylation domain-containing protein
MKSRQSGVTLLEMVMVIVLVGVAFAALAGLFAMAVRALPLNERTQSTGQLAQGCVERILSARHTPGFVFTTEAAVLQSVYCAMTNNDHSLLLTESVLSSSVCPTGLSCRHLTVRVTPIAGGVSSSLDFLLVQ